MAWSTDKEDARMLPDIPSLMKNAENDHLILKLVDICFDDMLRISCNVLVSLQNLEDWPPKSAKILGLWHFILPCVLY